jgi:hypothetical protein
VPEQIVVIVGAGASHDSTRVYPFSEGWRPPLVVDLFAERAEFTPILGFYPDAQSLAPDLRAATRTGAVGLEAHLRDHVVGSNSPYDRRRYRSIPLYLQHVLHEVSKHFTPHPVNYDRLINALLRHANEVLFLTLNYDTLLDKRLAIHTPITSLNDYIKPRCPWALIKLHGSVNWVKRVISPIEPGRAGYYLEMAAAELGEDLEVQDDILLIDRDDVAATRRPEADEYFYPAISVPLGPDDELNCPPSHVSHAKKRLTAYNGLHLLTIGYSGLDSGLLNLLNECRNSLKSLHVVNQNADASFEAAERIARALGSEATPDMASPVGFNAFAQGDPLENYLAQLD